MHRAKKAKPTRGGRVAKPSGTGGIQTHFLQRKSSRLADTKDATRKQPLLEETAVDVPVERPSVTEAEVRLEPEVEIPEDIKTLLADKEQLLQILRDFDLDYKYGPCVGLSRMERWERAAKLDLEPPDLIGKILTTPVVKKDSEMREALWFGTL
ncbi:hypothetical protein HDV00_009275 [Rhizophlyctis rosea]|nr:hypothetical protein HDV00_009275 [Rhizophlyctis rosea]